MKFSEQWLREWLPGSEALTTVGLAEKLTHLGLEVDDLQADPADPQDSLVTIKVPANRGDCFGLLGIARDVAAGLGVKSTPPFQTGAQNSHRDAGPWRVLVEAPEACPHYVAAVLSGIKPRFQTPEWMVKRLEKSGLRSVSGIVDAVNYVMLEMGQPMHAFDGEKLSGETLWVRYAKSKETLTLLDETPIALRPDTLVIADGHGPQAIAGVMGGLQTAVSAETTRLVLESAYFEPVGIRLTARQYGLRTDAVQRFERGTDPSLPPQALQRVVDLILQYGGGQVESFVAHTDPTHMPGPVQVALRFHKIQALLGYEIPQAQAEALLNRLGMTVMPTADGWQVTVPVHRAGIRIEADLIEELARLNGLDCVPSVLPQLPLEVPPQAQIRSQTQRMKQTLVARGYQEVITYSFIDPSLAELCFQEKAPLALLNPISSEKSVMRSSLLPGLLLTVQNHQRYGGAGCAFFEMGRCFQGTLAKCEQKQRFSGILEGQVWSSHWGLPPLKRDFFTAKADVEACLAIGLPQGTVLRFVPPTQEHPTLHPGESARIMWGEQIIGVMGTLHPRIQKALDLQGKWTVFELEVEALPPTTAPVFQPFSKYPAVSRDLALLVQESLSADTLELAIAQQVTDSDWLFKQRVFDVYQGKGVAAGHKSLGVTLFVQHRHRTLVEEEINAFIQRVLQALSQQYGIQLRD